MRYEPPEPENKQFSEVDKKALQAHCGALQSYALNFHLLDEDMKGQMLLELLDIAVLVRKYVK